MATTAPEEVRERVLSYISHQVAKGPDNIRETVQKGHDQLFRLIDGLSEEQAAFKPAPDVWSVLEVFDHVVTAKRGIVRLCTSLSRGEAGGGIGGEGQATEQDGITGKRYDSLAEARAAAQAAHDELLAFVETLSPDVNVEARHDHFLFGALNCQEWAAFQRIHDADHTGQIEQIKAAPGYPAA